MQSELPLRVVAVSTRAYDRGISVGYSDVQFELKHILNRTLLGLVVSLLVRWGWLFPFGWKS